MPENCLLITVDSLRADHLSEFGYDGTRTPTIEVLAEDGVSFERAFATGPGTSPSFPGLLTGTLPLSYGGLGPLRDDRPRVSKRLQTEGFETAAFHSNPFLSSHFNYHYGFDRFEDYQSPLMGVATRLFPRGIELNDSRLARVDEMVDLTGFIKKAYQLVSGKPRPYVTAEVITDDAVEWLSTAEDGFFCWAHYMDVHHPCFPPQSYRARHGVDDVQQSTVQEWYSQFLSDEVTLQDDALSKLRHLYDAAIEYTDDQIGRLIDELRSSGRYEDTLVIFTSDHGELFGEHGMYGKPFRMFDELLHVPLVVVNGPATLAGTSDELHSLLDVPPLIHDALGLEVPADYEGHRPGVDEPRTYVVAEHEVDGESVVGARTDQYLYEADEIENERRLYKLGPGQPDRVRIEEVPAADALGRIVRDRLAQTSTDSQPLEETVEDDDVKSRLEDLGYL